MKSDPRQRQHSEEIELKLALPSADSSSLAKRLSKIPLLARRKPAHQSLYNVYYDTPDQFLRQKRVALRIRRTGTELKPQWLQTLKMGGQDYSALSQRGEWEASLADATLSWDVLNATPWSLIDPDGAVFQALAPCFVTSFERTCWTVHRRDRSVIEIALDIGQIVTGDKSAPICELELELLAGQPQALFAIAQELASHIAVLPLAMSKAARGYALGQASLDTPVRGQPPLLTPDLPLPLAARQLLQEMFCQFLANLNALRSSDDPEVVHQARIGWRRFKSTGRLFRSALVVQEPPSLRPLEPLMTFMGELRDLDVARTETLPPLAASYTGGDARRTAEWEELVLAMLDAANIHRKAVRYALEEPAVGQSLLATLQWLEELSAGNEKKDAQKQREQPLPRWAKRRINRLHEQLKLALREADDPAGQHRVRILSKRIRYGIEALRPLLPKRSSRRWHLQAADLQSILGRTRDLMQASELAAKLGADRGLVAFLRGFAAGHKHKRE
jgi:inorganic triphosphatase YgiF